MDANILLDFYRFGEDDIDEVEKIVHLIEEQEIVLLSNSVLRDEVSRARDSVVSSSFNELRSVKLAARFPAYSQEAKALLDFKAALKRANELHKDLISEMKDSIDKRELRADRVIRKLFEGAQDIEVTGEVLDQASFRTRINNPPRKTRDSVADAIHWECLLSIQTGYKVHLVTRDSDFSSDLNPEELKPFLLEEWRGKFGKHSKPGFHTSLGKFFRQKYPGIKLSSFSEINALLQRLSTSPNFSTTHAVISELSGFDHFTRRQAQKAFYALVENTQVGWIATDEDVKEFFDRVKDQADGLPKDVEDAAIAALEEDEDYFFPF